MSGATSGAWLRGHLDSNPEGHNQYTNAAGLASKASAAAKENPTEETHEAARAAHDIASSLAPARSPAETMHEKAAQAHGVAAMNLREQRETAARAAARAAAPPPKPTAPPAPRTPDEERKAVFEKKIREYKRTLEQRNAVRKAMGLPPHPDKSGR